MVKYSCHSHSNLFERLVLTPPFLLDYREFQSQTYVF